MIYPPPADFTTRTLFKWHTTQTHIVSVAVTTATDARTAALFPLTTECQWADSDSVLVLMFDGGWLQSTLLTGEAGNKNWLCCTTVVRLWETGHWSQACDLCLCDLLHWWQRDTYFIFHFWGFGSVQQLFMGSYWDVSHARPHADS